MAKHKRVLRDGQTPRGPARWARAYGNLLGNPTSHGANLLIDRIVTAAEFRDLFTGPFEHRKVWADYTGKVYDNRKYATCSSFCAAMVIQLDIGSTKHTAVLDVFEGTYRHGYHVRGEWHESSVQLPVYAIDPEKLNTPRCQHCGTKIGA